MQCMCCTHDTLMVPAATAGLAVEGKIETTQGKLRPLREKRDHKFETTKLRVSTHSKLLNLVTKNDRLQNGRSKLFHSSDGLGKANAYDIPSAILSPKVGVFSADVLVFLVLQLFGKGQETIFLVEVTNENNQDTKLTRTRLRTGFL